MKKYISVALALILGLQLSSAQNCSQFINAVNGKKLVYANLDAKGKEVGRVNYTSVKKDASTITFHSEIVDKSGKTIGSGDSEVTCSGSSINVDMKSFIPPASAKQFSKMQMQADGKYLVYPLNLSAGQSLPDGSADIKIDNNGSQFAEIFIDITNRKVEQKETISTDCGNFDCFRISYDMSMKAKIMGIGIPVNMHVVEWFSSKLERMIKSETYNKGGKLVGTMQIESIN